MAQGMGNITGPDFCPRHYDPYAQLLFAELQSFMFSVLVISLLTRFYQQLIMTKTWASCYPIGTAQSITKNHTFCLLQLDKLTFGDVSDN